MSDVLDMDINWRNVDGNTRTVQNLAHDITVNNNICLKKVLLAIMVGQNVCYSC